MKTAIFNKKLVMVVFAATSIAGLIHTMDEGPKQGYLNRLYEWWKKVGNRDFTLYAFPVAQDQGKFYVLINANGTPISMPIQHRPHRELLPSPQIGITYLASAVPGLNIYWAKGRPMIGWGDVHQYYKERNQAYMAETLVERQTGGCFKKGAGIHIDDHWFWGRQLNYTKRACYMNRNPVTKQDENIVVFLKATYKKLNNCTEKLAWIDVDLLRYGKWHPLFLQYWNNKPLSTGGYRAGAKEKIWGRGPENPAGHRMAMDPGFWIEQE